ncbi:MAG: outer membrane beta-barrel protein [Chitinophagaceae bacterium]|nr:outer membrane beta-barrel protein [Chitinophagaceae bacterium]
MYRKLPLFLFFTVMSFQVFSQTTSVSGVISDTSQKKNIRNAVVALLTPRDSVLYRFTRTDANGNYRFTNVKEGHYILMTTHPFYADYLDDIEIKGPDQQIPDVAVTSKSKLLQEVIVKSGNPIRVKGDTTIYTADSFKVGPNANVEELLKKLPGIQVDRTGKITAMGEQVTKVLVDGEEFFGDDPGMAVKNLRADAVKEVQVFDKKSEQAEFTGIDDGKTQKTINLKLKEDKKHGYFGKVDIAGGLLKGIDDRYNSNILLSSFRGKRKLTGFLLTGNTGQDGLNWEDNNKYGLESDNYSMNLGDDGEMNFNWTGGSSDEEPYVSTENGFIRNINAGVQYSNKWKDKHTLNLTPRYNSQIYSNRQQSFSSAQYGDSLINTDGSKNSYVNRYNVKTSASYEVKLDSNNSLKLTLKANVYHTESDELTNTTGTGNTGTLKNKRSNDLSINSDKVSYLANLLYRHKFKKARRTLSIATDWNQLSTDGRNFLRSNNESYFNGILSSVQNIDQQKDFDKTTRQLTTRLVYTEPLSKKYSMELAYELMYNYGKNDQVTHTYSPLTQKYDVAVDSLTNDFKQAIWVNKPSLRISYADKKLKFSFGSGFGFTHFDLQDNTLNKDYIRNYTNFFPAASINYTYKQQHNLRFNYNGNTSQPSISQLQPLRDNSDYYNQYIGNPDLKPSFSNSFSLSHNSYNFLKDMFMYQSLNFRFTQNAITNNRVVNLDSGKTVSQPINTNGNFSSSFWGGTGFKMKKIDTRLDIGANFSYRQSTGFYNSLKNYSRTLGYALRLGLNKSKEKKYDFYLSNDVGYNSNTNTQGNTSLHYFTYNLEANATVYITKTWSVNSNFNYMAQQRTQNQASGLDLAQWNARMEKTFKKDEFTAYLSVRDILNQNVGISRNFDSNTYNEVRNDRLKRYWMVGFTWNFKNKGTASK